MGAALLDALQPGRVRRAGERAHAAIAAHAAWLPQSPPDWWLRRGGALGRIAAKHRLDDADEMAQLLERHTLDRTKMLQLAGKTAGKVLVEWMAERHLHERALKAAQLQWGWKCCVCFDSASLRQSLLKNGKTGEIDGFEDLFSVAAEEMSVAGLVEDRKQEIAKVVVLVVAVVESEYHRARVLHRS